MFTYICLGTNDHERAARFYDAVLGALGHRRCEAGDDWEAAGWRGWGSYERDGTTELALWLCPPFDGRPASVGNGTMVAFSRAPGKRWSSFTPRRSRTAEPPTVRPGCGRSTRRISTPPTSGIRTATSSPRCAADSPRRLPSDAHGSDLK